MEYYTVMNMNDVDKSHNITACQRNQQKRLQSMIPSTPSSNTSSSEPIARSQDSITAPVTGRQAGCRCPDVFLYYNHSCALNLGTHFPKCFMLNKKRDHAGDLNVGVSSSVQAVWKKHMTTSLDGMGRKNADFPLVMSSLHFSRDWLAVYLKVGENFNANAVLLHKYCNHYPQPRKAQMKIKITPKPKTLIHFLIFYDKTHFQKYLDNYRVMT